MTSIPSRSAIIASGAWLVGAAVLQAMTGLGVQILLMRVLPPDEFGRFWMVFAACGLVQTMLSLRLNIVILRLPEAGLTPERSDQLHSALCWETVFAAAVTLAWLAANDLVSVNALMLVLANAVGQWTNQVVTFYERSMPYRRLTTIETGSLMTGHLVGIAMALAGWGVEALYVRELVNIVVKTGLLIAIGAVRLRRWRWLTPEEWRALIREGRGGWADGVVEGGFSRLVVLASGWTAGLTGAGVFAQTQRLATIPHQFLSPLTNRLVSNLFGRIEDDRHRRRVLMGWLGATSLCLCVAAALAIGVGDPVIPMVFGEKWRPAVDALSAMAGVIVCFTLFDIFRVYCLSRRLARLILLARAAQYAVFLAGLWHATGAARPVIVLALALSASYVAACLVLAVAILVRRQGRVGEETGAA